MTMGNFSRQLNKGWTICFLRGGGWKNWLVKDFFSSVASDASSISRAVHALLLLFVSHDIFLAVKALQEILFSNGPPLIVSIRKQLS